MILAEEKRIRVAIVGPYPLDPSKTTGGIQAVIQNLVKGLKKFVDIHIITIDYDRDMDPIIEPDITLHYLPSSKGLNRLSLYYPERKWIRNTLRQINPDLVHVHGTDVYGYAVRNVRYPVLLTVHGILSQEGKIDEPDLGFWVRQFNKVKYSFNTFFERNTLKAVKHIVVISPYVEEMIRSYTSARMYHIDNPVDEVFFQLKDKTVPNRLLFVGMIRTRKGILNLLKAVHLIQKNIPDIQLNIVGKVFEPEYYKLLQDYIEDNNLGANVIFKGRISDKELYREFEECVAIILPSIEESSPMVVEQAMAAGKPVVATRVGGIPFLVEDRKSGILVEYGDISGLAEAITSVLRNPEVAREMGRRGQEIATTRFELSAIVDKTKKVYQEVIFNSNA